MCGRFFLRPDVDQILAWLDAEVDEGLVPSPGPRLNVAPTQEVLGVYVEPVTRTRRLGAFRWGLVPSWWKQDRLPTWINARSEEAADKPAFRGAMRSRRLLVPASGFYEWEARGRRKIPHAVTLPGGEPMAFAGLYETWYGRGEPLRSLTILTCDPCPPVSAVHDRMPVVLPREAWATWLDPRTPVDQARALLRPWDGPVEVREVGTGVNNARHTDGSWFSPDGSGSGPAA